MKVSAVLIWLCLSSVQPQRPTDQLAVEKDVHSDVWTELRELRNMVLELQVRQQANESQIEGMMQQNAAGRQKAAFSFASGLNGYFGPVKSDTTLVFQKQITNVGNAYNPRTGVFTAPVRGVYYFRFNLLGKSDKYRTSVYLFRNEEKIIKASTPPSLSYQYTIGGVTLVLRRGDRVYLTLLSGCEIFDTGNNHSTFSGFLISSF
ncbi:hypothetical protein NFI96_026237 [Prochilodus magdalenae]|nr:hypothetical protein NFI96_026237 [Prochilodus magdalenae]